LASSFWLDVPVCRPPHPNRSPRSRCPTAGQATLPHAGALAELSRWWTQFDDPMLERVVGAAQAASPTIASAAARIEQARATRTAAGAALLPALDADASAARGVQDVTLPHGTSASIGLQASWELDLFGRRRAARDAADARLEGADAAWHDARVAVAAETAGQYVDLRGCEALLAQARLEANSRAETARLTDLSMRSGFESRANASLAVASAAQTRAAGRPAGGALRPDRQGAGRADGRSTSRRCERCSARTRARCRSRRRSRCRACRPMRLRSGPTSSRRAATSPPRAPTSRNPKRRAGRASHSPAASAQQRFESGGDLARRHDLEHRAGQRQPADLRRRDARAPTSPPRGRATTPAVVAYGAALRNAVRDVESALIALQASAERRADAQLAADHFDAYTRAVEAKYRSGLGSLFELEDARRSAFAAQITLIDLRRDQVAAWIALYRALGGGWTAPPDAALATAAPSGQPR
jgi:outer membrane protein TolC